MKDIKNLEVFKKWEKYKVPAKNYILAGSALLYVLGIRKKISDLDIVVTDEESWGKLKKDIELKKSLTTDEVLLVLEKGKIEVNNSFLSKYIELDFLSDDIVIEINGIRFLALEVIKSYKKLLKRPKDYYDLNLINKYENKN